MKQPNRLWVAIKLSLKVLFVIGVFVGIFSYAMFQGGFVSWFLFYTITMLVILMLLYAAIPLGSFHVTRDMGEGARIAGSEMKVTVRIQRKWPFPFLYLSVTDEIGDSLKKQIPAHHSKMIFYPTVKKELEYSYTVSSIKRGEYFLYGIYLETSDMFGLFKKRKFIEIKESLLVYPNYHEIERWSAFERHDMETRLSSMDFVEDITSVAGSREYVPGDKLTSIDWKVTARASKLMTKEFEEYIGQNFLVIFNNHVPNKNQPELEAYEKGIELVTSIVMYATKKRLQIGLWTLGEANRAYPLDAGADHQKRLITHLSKVEADGKGNFASRLKEYESEVPTGTTMIIVSAELTDQMLERIKVFLSRRVQVYFCLMDRGNIKDSWEEKRFEEIKRLGAEAYLLSGGNLDQAITTNAGD
ncbi:DUF58 domain-containing protein [Bacillus shivajii]|uniref:DUF58 domain-containing protein n=1 Tax=Bacillus shivajii TaxID=1983719 RepID=UPI001CF9C956|nr:DUF58 domain-containing protein [Bacillus shivajii]UCZ53777.1 DUF58 domain-containing protein [Bacillus shivajii]